jgi:hypothetical protein
MAHDSIVANLFGLDPALLGQQRQQQDNVFGMQMAQLSPEQAAAAPVYSMTQNLGRQVGSLLGIEDPQIAENSKILAVKKKAREMGLDPQTSAGLKGYAQLLADAGMEDKAMQAGQKALQMAELEAKNGKAQGDLLRESQFRQAMSSLDPASPTYQQDLMKIASQYGSADKVMDVHTKSLDRQERLEAKKEELKQKHLDRMEELKLRGADQKEMQRERLAFQAQMQAMNAELRRDLASSRTADASKPPAGYRFKPNGDLEAIPGGPADLKATAAAEKDKTRAAHNVGQAETVIATIDDALAKTGWWETGLTGAAIGMVPGTNSYDLRKTVDTVKANVGFDALQRMRESSPTGGALGQVAVQELNMLQASVANLDANQSKSEVEKKLKAVKKHYENWKKVMEKASATGQATGSKAPPDGFVLDN